MKVWTGYFGKLKQYHQAGLFPIGISRYPPQWYEGVSYQALAPRGDMLKLSKPNYIREFDKILANLTQEQVLGDLMEMTGGRDVVLMCFETLRNPNYPEEWCHRQFVATWLELYGINVKEWTGAEVVPDLSLF